MNSRQKGAAGERELANLLKEYGYDTRRGQQYSGINGDADVVGIPGLHIECKRVEKLNLDAALEQSKRDAREGEIPVVMHRKNRKEWKLTLLLDDFIMIYRDETETYTKKTYSDKEIERIKRTARASGVSDTVLLCIAVMADTLKLSEDQIIESAKDLENWARHLEEHAIQLRDVAETIETHTGLRFAGLRWEK